MELPLLLSRVLRRKPTSVSDAQTVALSASGSVNSSSCESTYSSSRGTPTSTPPSDENVERVRAMLHARMQAGYQKYGVTTERVDIDLAGWLQHLQEELLDAAVYVERIKREL